MTTETSTATMRAFALDAFGAPSTGTIRTVPKPQVGEGEILIAVHATGVNPSDLGIISGFAKDMMEHHFPLIPGADAAGVVEVVGPGVTQFSPGDEVFGLFFKLVQGEGTYADYVVVPAAGLVARKPASLDFSQAAALPTPGLAAYHAVAAIAPGPGQTVLIVGAAGGVGSYAVQLAARRGARVIATGLPGQEAYLRTLGAVEVVDYAARDVVDTVKAAHPAGIDALIDLVSRDAESLGRNATILKRGGRVATTMNTADPEVLEGLGVEGTNVNGAMISTPADLDALAELVTTGQLTVPIAHIFALEEAPQAFERLQSGEVQGKLVLDCRTA